MHVREMIGCHPDVQGNTADALIACVEHCASCAQICTSCADACVAEPQTDMLKQCIRLNLDCADLCFATAAMGVRRTGQNIDVLRAVIEACEIACRACAEECSRHASMHEHCRICAESSQSCADACSAALPQVK